MYHEVNGELVTKCCKFETPEELGEQSFFDNPIEDARNYKIIVGKVDQIASTLLSPSKFLPHNSVMHFPAADLHDDLFPVIIPHEILLRTVKLILYPNMPPFLHSRRKTETGERYVQCLPCTYRNCHFRFASPCEDINNVTDGI